MAARPISAPPLTGLRLEFRTAPVPAEPPAPEASVEPPAPEPPVEPPAAEPPVEPSAIEPVTVESATDPVEPGPAETTAAEPDSSDVDSSQVNTLTDDGQPTTPSEDGRQLTDAPEPPAILHSSTDPETSIVSEPQPAPSPGQEPEPQAVAPSAVTSPPDPAPRPDAEPETPGSADDREDLAVPTPETATSADTTDADQPDTDQPDDEGSTSAVQASSDTVRPLPAGSAAGSATALRAPTMLTPVVRPGTPDNSAAPVSAPPEQSNTPDPEQVLASYQWRFHPETLRELVEDPDELRSVRDRLTERINAATENAARARLLSLRAVVSRILGDLGKALADGKLALAHAEATGELRRIAIAQARLAHVLQWRGDFAEADRLFAEANSSELPDRLRATMHEHAGRSCYDQGRYMEACNHFERALELRKVEDPDLIARTELALDAVFNKVAQNGWGPYPRTQEEILQVHRAPVPHFDEESQSWGYANADGEVTVAPAYADVQPFRDGVAWVRRPEVGNWELIDESGQVLIEAAVGYSGVSSFSDGLAWVSRDGTGGWIAIDKDNRVVIPDGFDDVRPFRRGIAAVRRGGWGAVDRTGQVVLPTRYDGFVTALTDGRYVEGFTDEGLAVVNAGGRKGVFDRSGRMLVPLVHPALVIHPVAFLIGNGAGQWGALDRHGQPLIDVVHPSRTDVMDEIDRLLADTTPVL